MAREAPPDLELEELLKYLKADRGFDFTAYKRASLSRRISRRMQDVGISSYAEYLDYLQVHPSEFDGLFDTVLINVTRFFRDGTPWEYLEREVIPGIAEAGAQNGGVRVWCAACATGEEAYSVAILLAEAMGDEEFRHQAKVYATDVDEGALTAARAAVYPARTLEPIGEERLERFFERCDGGFVFRPDLRRSVIFGRHDLIQDAPIPRLDMLVCRNALIYFNSDAQRRILRQFHFALRPDGYLFLGNSEVMVPRPDAFAPVDLRNRVFRKLALAQPLAHATRLHVDGHRDGHRDGKPQRHLAESAFEASGHAQLVIDSSGALVLASEAARSLFRLDAADIGRSVQDLELSYRPVELRSMIDEARAERRVVSLFDVEWGVDGTANFYDVKVLPLLTADGSDGAVAVTFADVTPARSLTEQLHASKRELETAYEELQSTVEELETTNEELQSTNEELETTNEELQSTVEELETMNEELQATNEELATINDELSERTVDLDDANTFLEHILVSLHAAVVSVDRDLRVRVWNRYATELWGLRENEVQGEYLIGLDIGLPVAELETPLRACLSGASEREERALKARDRRGRSLVCSAACTPQRRPDGQIVGAVLVLDAAVVREDR